MSETPIWRYMSLAKYIDLLKTKSLYFPKASIFQDDTEGKWVLHSLSLDNKQHCNKLKQHIEVLSDILSKQKEQDITEIVNEFLNSDDERIYGALRDVLKNLKLKHSIKKEDYLKTTIENWGKQIKKQEVELNKKKSEAFVKRESTYISCWNSSPSMSIALFELYGGSDEAVAVKSTKEKLENIIKYNNNILNNYNLNGGVTEVKYIEGEDLKNPTENIKDYLLHINKIAKGSELGSFSIKPKIYKDEKELRAILYHNRDPYEPVEDPYPNLDGILLPVGVYERDLEPSIYNFIDKVYLHPKVDETSMMYKVLIEIHNKFAIPDIPIVTDKIEAFGPEVEL